MTNDLHAVARGFHVIRVDERIAALEAAHGCARTENSETKSSIGNFIVRGVIGFSAPILISSASVDEPLDGE